jgi:AmiR/NasT family two-component response regulator
MQPSDDDVPTATVEPPRTAARTVPIETLPERPTRILVADDEHLVATDLALTLGELGYTVVGPAADGEAAVHLARLSVPDLALLDIQMPKRDGLSAAAELMKELGVPVVILSAYSDAENVDGAQKAGVFGYLVKPVQEDQLRVAIEVAWSRFRLFIAERSEAESLRRRLEERKVIEQAKWILVSRKGITEPEAMQLLQRKARDTRRKLGDVALEVVRANELL